MGIGSSSFLSLSGLSPAESDRRIMEDVFLEANMRAVPLRLLNLGIEKACKCNKTVREICLIAKKLIQEAVNRVPEHIRTPIVLKKAQLEREFVKHNVARGIPREEARYAFESIELLVSDVVTRGVGGALAKTVSAAKKLTKSLKGSQTSLNPALDTGGKKIADYLSSKNNFKNNPKEFNGILKNDLPIVQYRGEGSSFNWWTTTAEANRFFSLNDVSQQLALLTKFGERVEVAYAVIPKGKEVRFLHGKASFKLDIKKLEFKKGGGVQYRFFDFDPSWIRKTRPLPQPPLTMPFASRFKKVLHISKTHLVEMLKEQVIDQIFGALLKERDMLSHQLTDNSSINVALDLQNPKKPIMGITPPPLNKLKLQGSLQVNPLKPKESFLSVQLPISQDQHSITTELLLNPFKPKKPLLSVQHSVALDQHTVTTGLLLNPFKPKKSILSASYGPIGVELTPFKPKKIILSASYGPIGANLDLKNLNNSTITLTVPVYGIPIGVSVPLRKIQNLSFSIGIPQTPIRLSISGKTIGKTAKKVGHTVEKTFKGIFGGKRKKRKKGNKVENHIIDQKLTKEFAGSLIELSKSLGQLRQSSGQEEQSLGQLEQSFVQLKQSLDSEPFPTQFKEAVELLQGQNQTLSSITGSIRKEIETFSLIDLESECSTFKEASQNLENKSEELSQGINECSTVLSRRSNIDEQLVQSIDSLSNTISKQNSSTQRSMELYQENGKKISRLLRMIQNHTQSKD